MRLSQRLPRRNRPSRGRRGRWIKVSWGSDTNDSYPTTLEVVCKDRLGLLLDISAALCRSPTPLCWASTSRSTEDQFAIFRLEVRIKDGDQLKSLMNKLNQISGVLRVTRPPADAPADFCFRHCRRQMRNQRRLRPARALAEEGEPPMRAVVTRVHHASVTIDGEVRGRIGQGLSGFAGG